MTSKIVTRNSLAVVTEDFEAPILNDDGTLGSYVTLQTNAGLTVRDFSPLKKGIVVNRDGVNYFVNYKNVINYLNLHTSSKDTTPISAVYIDDINDKQAQDIAAFCAMITCFAGIIGIVIGAVLKSVLG